MNKRQKEIQYIKGYTKALIIAPHGVMGNDNRTNIIAEELQNVLGCSAIINEKYYKTSTTGGNRPNPKKNILDLNRTKHATMVPGDRYLSCVVELTNEIIEKHGKAYVFHIHGIINNNIIAAARKVPPEKLICKASEVDILIGYGQCDQRQLEFPPNDN